MLIFQQKILIKLLSSNYISYLKGKNPFTFALKLKASYRYRDAINDSVADRTNTYKVGADYDINKTTFVTGSVGRTTGDKEYTSIQGGVGIRF